MIKNSKGRDRERKLRGGRLRPDGSREHVYTPELATEICRRVSLGETLTVVCKSLGVDPATVRDWVVGDRDGFAQVHARARRSQVEAWSDELLAIADDNTLEPNDRRVRLDVRKWLMARLNPARYGDRVQLAGDPENPVRHVVDLDLAQLTEVELAALERFADARIAAKDVQDLKEGQ
jgi:hypothetical protein